MAKLTPKPYSPVVRSRDAELKGLRELSAKVKDDLLPIVELTKSRRSKSNADGSVSVSLEKVQEALEGRYFVADVTTMKSLSNADTEGLLDQAQGFRRWRDFVAAKLPENAIPVVHLTSPLDTDILRAQCEALIQKSGYVAVRIPSDYDEADALKAALSEVLGDLSRVVLICDGGFVTKASYGTMLTDCVATLGSFGKEPFTSIVASSGFPISVVLPDYGKDAYGKFDLLEVSLSEAVRATKGLRHVVHGDYGLIHPADFEGTVTNWVPRVDVPLDRSVFYHRYRRDAGGYTKAARLALADTDYVSLECWGDRNIQNAAAGNPQGRNPAHWIAVRLNFHISRQAERLR